MPETQTGPYRRFYARDVFAVERYPLHVRRHLLQGNHIPHDHDFVEAVLILGGQGRHRAAGGEMDLKAGDTLLLRPGVWHFYHDCQNLDVYNCCFGVDLLQRELAAIAQNPALDNLLVSAPLSAAARGVLLLHQDETGIDTCRRCLDAILAADAAGRNGGHEAVATVEKIGNLLLFLAHLSRAALDADRLETSGDTRSLHPAVREAVARLEADPAHLWSLTELAQSVCLERSYLSRLFKAGTGLAPLEYLARCRAERAAKLLLRTEDPVQAIGEAVGWPDPNYFARRFRAHFGLSASEYRARFGLVAEVERG